MARTDPPTPRDGGRAFVDLQQDDPDEYLGAAPDPAGLYVGASHPAERTTEMPVPFPDVSDGQHALLAAIGLDTIPRSTPAVHATPRERATPSALAVHDAIEHLEQFGAGDNATEADYAALETVLAALRERGEQLAALRAFLDLADRSGDGRVSTAAIREALR